MNNTNIPVRLFFSKTGRAKYISALDLINCFQRAIRRTDIPVWLTQGFNPHTYVNINLPLSLGTEGINESMDIKLVEEMDLQAVKQKLNNVLPVDIRITRAAYPIKKHTEIQKSVYTLYTDLDRDLFKSFLAQEKIITEKKTKKGITEIDLKPYIEFDEADDKLLLTLPSGCDFTINPSLVISCFERYSGKEISKLDIVRTRILCKDGTVFE